MAETLCVLSWSDEARAAYAKALRSWRRAGSPPVPLGATNYRAEFFASRRKRGAKRERDRPRH